MEGASLQMIHRKKILSLLLAASMLLTAAPAAYAADNPENPQPVDKITAELPEELPDYADGGIRPHIHNRDPLRPEYNTSNKESASLLEEEDEGLDPLTWDMEILSWELIQGTEDPNRSWNDRDDGNELHKIHEENGRGNFVVLGVTRDSDMGIGKFTFKRPVDSSYTAIRYSKFRPGGGYGEEESGVVQIDSNNGFSVQVSENDCPWAYEITYGSGTSEDDFTAETCTYCFYFEISRLRRIDQKDISWSSNDNTVVDANFDYPLSKEFNISCGAFHLYVDKDASSPATANLIFYRPFSSNYQLYARYWKHIPGNYVNESVIKYSIVPVNDDFVSIPVNESEGSMVYNIQFGRLDNNGNFYNRSYTYAYQVFWETEMTWDNISYHTEGVTPLSEYKTPAVSDGYLITYPNYYNGYNWLDVPVEEIDDTTGTMTITVSCPKRLRNKDGLIIQYKIDDGIQNNVLLSDDSFTFPAINFSGDTTTYQICFITHHEGTENSYEYYEQLTPVYSFEIFFRSAYYEDYLPVSITDWRFYGNNEPQDIEVRIHNRQNKSGTLIIAAYRGDGRLIKAVTAPFDSETKDWVHADGLAAAVDQAAYLKVFAIDSDTFIPICPPFEINLLG